MDFESTPEFEEQFSKLTRKNKALKERFLKKISQILDNPSIGSQKPQSKERSRHPCKPLCHRL